MSKKKRGRGRPLGTVMYDGGVLRFAVQKEEMQQLRQRSKLGKVSLSEMARIALKCGLKALEEGDMGNDE